MSAADLVRQVEEMKLKVATLGQFGLFNRPFYSISLVSVDDFTVLVVLCLCSFAETVLAKTVEDLHAKDLYLDRKEKQLEEIEKRILLLQSSLVDAKVLILYSIFVSF